MSAPNGRPRELAVLESLTATRTGLSGAAVRCAEGFKPGEWFSDCPVCHELAALRVTVENGATVFACPSGCDGIAEAIKQFGSFGSYLGGEKKDPNPETPASGSTEPKTPFAAPMSEKLANVPPEPNWIWEGYLSPGALTLLAGRPKVGKTTLLFPLIAALERGVPFLDRPTEATRVLMLSEEREQTLAEKRHLYLDGADPQLLMRHEQGQRTWPQIVEQARAYCAAHEIGVLLVDTWDKWTGLRGDDESKSGAVIEALEPLMLAAGDGLAVLIVAHQRKAAGKHGEAVRGSNAITGGVDVIVELERAPEELGKRMRILRAESRFTATPDELVGELTEDGYVAQGEYEEVKRAAEVEKVVGFVEAAPGATSDELAEAADLAPATMKHKLKAAFDDGRIARDGSGRKGDPYRWRPRSDPGEPDRWHRKAAAAVATPQEEAEADRIQAKFGENGGPS